MGGRQLTQWLAKELCVSFEIADKIKKDHCFLGTPTDTPLSYKLPDGCEILIPGKSLTECPNQMFKPCCCDEDMINFCGTESLQKLFAQGI